MEVGEEESSADQLNSRKAREEGKTKEKEKRNKNKKRRLGSIEQRTEDGDAHNCSVGEAGDDENVEGKFNDAKEKNKKKQKGNQGIEEQLDIFSSEVTNRKTDTQNGKRKRESRGCSNMNGGEACVGQSKCNDRKPLAREDDGHVRYDFEVEGRSTSKKREEKQKRATIMKNSSEGNNQKKTGNDVSTVETTEETQSEVASKRVVFADTMEVFSMRTTNRLGENGVEKLLNCSKHKLRGCWKEIAKSLPWRDRISVYLRGRMLLKKGGGERIGWTPEDLDLIVQYHKEHGSKWLTLAEALGRYRNDVKDMFRKVSLGPLNKGKWTPEELDALYNLVNKDLRSRSIYERKTHQGQFRDNIAWTAISEQMGTRHCSACCIKWYGISSPMVSQKLWDDTDDYRLVDALAKLDPSSFVEVDWDSLLDHSAIPGTSLKRGRVVMWARKRLTTRVQRRKPHCDQTLIEGGGRPAR
ncbi:hypothetical protein MLD38_005598 [Melastoma candidum]|uniref:Uncharacterized protein n=1 Tax=Melastoma candidum TaxID=119954 RepID=A0ACB9RKQ5_9MYRT|nr:hypothetical protein MLD38_005598 [Melastoma candidum]